MKMVHEWLSKWKQLREGHKELSGLYLWNQDSHSKWNNLAKLEGLVSSLPSLGHAFGFAFADILYPDLVNLTLNLAYSLSEALIPSAEVMPTLILPCPTLGSYNNSCWQLILCGRRLILNLDHHLY